MWGKLLLLLHLFLVSKCIVSTNIECEYICAVPHWEDTGNILTCDVTKTLVIESLKTVEITSVNGSLYRTSGECVRDTVLGLFIGSKTVKYFPRNLITFFSSLNVIGIYKCQLEYIQQSNLKDFTDLELLYLKGNNIKTLDEGLFNYNLKLRYIDLSENQISHITDYIFDHLSNLKYLNLNSNKCTHMHFNNNSTDFCGFLEILYGECQDSEYLNIIYNLKFIEGEEHNENMYDVINYIKKLDEIKIIFEDSKYTESIYLNERIENLSKLKYQFFTIIRKRIEENERSIMDWKNVTLTYIDEALKKKQDELAKKETTIKAYNTEIKELYEKVSKLEKQLSSKCQLINIDRSSVYIGDGKLDAQENK